MKFIRPKNWMEFQHYKDRAPPWIKLHKGLLDDQEFNELDGFSAKVLVLFWLMASECENGCVAYNAPKIAFRMRLATTQVAESLEKLINSGFVVSDGLPDVPAESLASAKKMREAAGWGSRHISDDVKREVWARDNGVCVQCGCSDPIEYDHIIPVSKGGNSESRNVQLLCRTCNRKKRTSVQVEHVATQAQQPLNMRTTEAETQVKTETQTKTEAETEGDAREARSPKRAGRVSLPDGFPGHSERQWAEEFWIERKRPDLVAVFGDIADQFLDYHARHGTRAADWPATWRTWARKSLEFNKPPEKQRISAHDKGTLGLVQFVANAERSADATDLGGGTGTARNPLPANGHGPAQVADDGRRFLVRLPALDGPGAPGSVPPLPHKP